jgi:hypothetical protein
MTMRSRSLSEPASTGTGPVPDLTRPGAPPRSRPGRRTVELIPVRVVTGDRGVSPPTPHPRRRRLLLTLLALPGLLGSALVGALVVPWQLVYGAWPEDGDELSPLVWFGYAIVVGLVLWLAACAAVSARSSALWCVVLVVSLLAPALVFNGFRFQDARQRVCEIRAANGHDELLHPVPWPLGLDCPYGPDIPTSVG